MTIVGQRGDKGEKGLQGPPGQACKGSGGEFAKGMYIATL